MLIQVGFLCRFRFVAVLGSGCWVLEVRCSGPVPRTPQTCVVFTHSPRRGAGFRGVPPAAPGGTTRKPARSRGEGVKTTHVCGVRGTGPEHRTSNTQHPEPSTATKRKRQRKPTWISMADQKGGALRVLW